LREDADKQPIINLAVETLRNLWETAGAKETIEWLGSESNLLQTEDMARLEKYGKTDDSETTNEDVYLPHNQGSVVQLKNQFVSLVQEVSCEEAQSTVTMYCLRKATTNQIVVPEQLNETGAYNITFCDANGRRADRPNGGMYVNETDQANTLTTSPGGSETVIIADAPRHTQNAKVQVPQIVYSFDSLALNSMKSKNPNSGCREVEIAKTIDTTYPDPAKNQGGIAILCVATQQGEAEIMVDKCPTITAAAGMSGNNQPYICPANEQQMIAFACNQRDEVRDLGDIASALQAQPGMKQQMFYIQGSMIGRKDENGPQGSGINEDVRFTLNTIDQHAVAYGIGNGQVNQPLDYDKVGTLNCMHDQQAVLVAGVVCRNATENSDLCGTLQAKGTGGFSLNCTHPVRVSKTVRKLTPTECLRLMGLPDWWVSGVKSSDRAIYKMCGNGVVLHCVHFILQNIAMLHQERECARFLDTQ